MKLKLKSLSLVVACMFAGAAIAADQASPGAAGANSGSGASDTGSTGSGLGSAAFESMDKDGDGVVSKKEAKKDRTLSRQWKQLDADKDGKLSRSEYEAGTAAGSSGGTSGSGAMGTEPRSGDQPTTPGAAGSSTPDSGSSR